MARLETTIQFAHSGDRLVVTLNSGEKLGEMLGEVSATREVSGWGAVPGLEPRLLTSEGAAYLGVPVGEGWRELITWITPLEPNELDGWLTYLFEVRPSLLREPTAVVALTETYEVAECWPIPQDAAALG